MHVNAKLSLKSYINPTSPKQRVCVIINRRYYSNSSPSSVSSNLPPIPILTFNNLNNEDSIESYRELLKNKGGIYSFINTVNGRLYWECKRLLFKTY